MSTTKAREVLGQGEHTIREDVDAKKVKFDEDAVWDLVRKYEVVVIAKGKTVLELPPVMANRDAILKEVMGRSGNLRAPSVAVGSRLLVGFNETMYKGIFG